MYNTPQKQWISKYIAFSQFPLSTGQHIKSLLMTTDNLDLPSNFTWDRPQQFISQKLMTGLMRARISYWAKALMSNRTFESGLCSLRRERALHNSTPTGRAIIKTAFHSAREYRSRNTLLTDRERDESERCMRIKRGRRREKRVFVWCGERAAIIYDLLIWSRARAYLLYAPRQWNYI